MKHLIHTLLLMALMLLCIGHQGQGDALLTQGPAPPPGDRDKANPKQVDRGPGFRDL